ncbi:hypothetical protein RHSIM_Rhsim08G0181700 [Rhododendron simsii]|uniref:Dihydroflavonol 4-reductase n=1 Tax=Rhododendron simsii TaxID=118357 RepID=A0A834GHL6_RHOSS|nr:hypothetical protein RHSIM_Rhsim08G0181700 [Rhododendron simsii]
MSGAGKVVCVTGASGYIASWIVKLLLDRGYTVKGTVRSLSDPKKMDHLLSLHGAKERLQLFEANLMEEGSFDSVVDGCECVFHTASPVFLESSNPQDELIKPAVKGTQNVLGSCAKVPSIKRVVLTSSMASVAFNSRPRNPDVVIDETWFSDPVYCEESKLFYHLSKTLAEDAAWKFARENGIDLVTINPGFVFGPLLQPTLNFTSEGALNLIKNVWFIWQPSRKRTTILQKEIKKDKLTRDSVILIGQDKLRSRLAIRVAQPFLWTGCFPEEVIANDYLAKLKFMFTYWKNYAAFGDILIICNAYKASNLLDAGPDGAVYRYVDVRDVALAHILAYEVSSASGRYCLVGTVTNSSEAVNILRKLYPALKLPERPEDGKPAEPLYQISKKKAESLGIHFTPLEVTLRDTVESLKEKNFLQF